MAPRSKKQSSGRKVHLAEVLPIWTTAHSSTVNLAFHALLLKLGITDVSSYFRKLRIPIVICIVVGALVAASFYGLKGFFLGGLLGMIAPAALLWLGVMLVGATIFIAIYAAAWAAIVAFIWWFIGA
ncbi:MAG TPA: hypothetical protein VIK56_08655 [Rhodoferax sp.]